MTVHVAAFLIRRPRAFLLADNAQPSTLCSASLVSTNGCVRFLPLLLQACSLAANVLLLDLMTSV
jgi:hypothetical protein